MTTTMFDPRQALQPRPAAEQRAAATPALPTAPAERPDYVSIYVSSIAAVTAIFFFGVALPCWYAFDLGIGLGLGAMCAVWGGPGFGTMAGAARVASWFEAHELEM